MSVTAHPSVDTLADYVGGALPMAPGLVLAAHLGHCGQCRAQAAGLQDLAGAFLASTPAASLGSDALQATLRRIDSGAAEPKPAARRRRVPGATDALAAAGIGLRRWFGPGRWIAPVRAGASEGWRTFLLRAPAGARLPTHGHSGPEFTCILQGAYRDGPRIYRAGDFTEAGDAREHRIEVTGDAPCLCVIACRGPLRWSGTTALFRRIVGAP